MAESDVWVRLKADNKGLKRGVDKGKKNIRSFASSAKRQLRSVARASKQIARKLVSPFAALLGGAAIIGAGKKIIDFNADLTRLAIQGDLTTKSQAELRKEMIDVGYAAGQMRTEVLRGLDKIVEKTGDIEFARKSMENLAIAATGAGAEMFDMGAIAITLKEKFGLGADKMNESLNLLFVQGKKGAFTLENIAKLSERLFASAGRLDMTGMEDLRKMGAFMQMARMSTGSPEQATTAVERTLANIITKQEKIKKLGFDVLNPDKTFKGLDEILKGIIIATKGEEKILGPLFGEECIRAVSEMAKLYRATTGFALYDSLVGADAGRANDLMKAFARYSKESKFQLTLLGNAAWEFADVALSKGIGDLTTKLREITSDPDKLQRFREDIQNIAEALSLIASAAKIALLPVAKIIGHLGKFRKSDEFLKGVRSIDASWGAIPKKHRKLLKKRFRTGRDIGEINRMQYMAPEKEERYRLSRKRAIEFYTSLGQGQRENLQNQININLNVDKSGRLKSSVRGNNTTVKTNYSENKFEPTLLLQGVGR